MNCLQSCYYFTIHPLFFNYFYKIFIRIMINANLRERLMPAPANPYDPANDDETDFFKTAFKGQSPASARGTALHRITGDKTTGAQ